MPDDALLSWSEAKARLKDKTHAQLLGLLGECYRKNKSVREYLSIELLDSEDERQHMLATLEKELRAAFWAVDARGAPKGPFLREVRAILSKTARLTKADPTRHLDMLLQAAEHGIGFSAAYGDMNERYYDTIVRIFDEAATLLCSLPESADTDAAHGRMTKMVAPAQRMGWGFYDDLTASLARLSLRGERV